MIGAATRRFVRERAGHRCEYCRTRQDDEPFVTYQTEHVIAIQHGGDDDPDNLALACSHCNHHKGPNLAGIDPDTGAIVPLYHPRREEWAEHFRIEGNRIFGRTATGRTTVRVLVMNAQTRVDLRAEVDPLDAE
jgi:hypothetical protein